MKDARQPFIYRYVNRYVRSETPYIQMRNHLRKARGRTTHIDMGIYIHVNIYIDM